VQFIITFSKKSIQHKTCIKLRLIDKKDTTGQRTKFTFFNNLLQSIRIVFATG